MKYYMIIRYISLAILFFTLSCSLIAQRKAPHFWIDNGLRYTPASMNWGKNKDVNKLLKPSNNGLDINVNAILFSDWGVKGRYSIYWSSALSDREVEKGIYKLTNFDSNKFEPLSSFYMEEIVTELFGGVFRRFRYRNFSFNPYIGIGSYFRDGNMADQSIKEKGINNQYDIFVADNSNRNVVLFGELGFDVNYYIYMRSKIGFYTGINVSYQHSLQAVESKMIIWDGYDSREIVSEKHFARDYPSCLVVGFHIGCFL